MITDFCDNINELDEHLADKLELFDEKYTSLLPFKKRVSRYLRYINFKIWVCITLVAFLVAMNGFVCDRLGAFFFKRRLALIASIHNAFLRYLCWVFITTSCALAATFLCDKYSKEAQGSGVPEIKTYLSGLRITQFISPISYIIKFAGLVLMDSSGFFIGKEGPFIQMSTMIAKYMSKIPYFKKINKVSLNEAQIQF
jgi:H+/Cl- antiporter ClcA